MGFKLLFILAYRNVLRNPRRSLLTLSAIAVGIISSNMLAALSRGMQDQLIEDTIRNLTGHIQIHAPQYLDDPTVDYSMAPADQALLEVLDAAQVKTWAPRVRVPGVVRSERESAGVEIVGIVPQKENSLSFIGSAVSEGRFLNSADDSGLLIGKKLADFLQTRLGKRVVLMSQNTKNKLGDRGFRIVGVYDAELESTEKTYVFVGLKTIQKMLALGTDISELSLLVNQREMIPQITAELSGAATSRQVKPWTDLEPLVVSMVEVQGQFLYFWYIIVVIAVAFGLINTLFMAIYERTREIGLFQALGMSGGLVVLQVVLESVVLLIGGAIVGNLLTLAGVYLLRDGIDLSSFAAGTEMFGLSSMIYPKLQLFDSLIVNILVFVLGALCSLYPAWRASQLSPVRAIARG